ncbi:DNA-binding transcriptional regulator, AcrR family [Rhodococcus triatomae]|uniref:DNA-binding transcriptional regulator, AcrR family n=1 Tax=Rhodococcus triatomae TaxID=300028 RepID=A0A1G7ZQ33_9NOCA|nr:DNA-binding transcriptional regulator, AcrR family [Rhodococcus triatomae]
MTVTLRFSTQKVQVTFSFSLRLGRLVRVTEQLPKAPGLRERKRLEAMQRIQAVALDLFDRHGYRTVTIEQVAAQAQVSPSSVYRYFGTKERLVLHDEYDPQILEMLRTVDPGATWTVSELMQGLRAGIAFVMAAIGPEEEVQIQRRMRYVVTEPDVRAGMTRDAEHYEAEIRSIVASRLGRDEDDLEVRVLVAMAVWGFISAVYHWVESGFSDPLGEVVDTALAVFTRGPGSTSLT